MPEIIQREVRVKILGKRESTRGWIFKKPKYELCFETCDEKLVRQFGETREVPFGTYCKFNEGDILLMTLYAAKGDDTWYYTRGQAIWANTP